MKKTPTDEVALYSQNGGIRIDAGLEIGEMKKGKN